MNVAPIINKKMPILSAEHPAEVFLLRASAGALLAFVCLYLYFVSASILNVIARSEAEHRSAVLEGAVGALQQEYFTLSQSISPRDEAALGLAPVGGTSYVRRPSEVGIANTPVPSISDNAI